MTYEIHHGDALDVLLDMPPEMVQCIVTSPPYYGLRAYGGGGEEIGGESTPDEYVERLVSPWRGNASKMPRRMECNEKMF